MFKKYSYCPYEGVILGQVIPPGDGIATEGKSHTENAAASGRSLRTFRPILVTSEMSANGLHECGIYLLCV